MIKENVIQLFKFGCPFIQSFYRHLSTINNISFENFKTQLVDSTNLSYCELEDFWCDGIDVTTRPNNLFNIYDLKEILIDKYLIIHFDLKKNEIIGFDNYNYKCYVDENDNYFNILI